MATVSLASKDQAKSDDNDLLRFFAVAPHLHGIAVHPALGNLCSPSRFQNRFPGRNQPDIANRHAFKQVAAEPEFCETQGLHCTVISGRAYFDSIV